MTALQCTIVFFAALAIAVRPLLPGHESGTGLWVALCVLAAAVAWLVRMALERRARLARTGVGVPLLVLLAIAGLSTLRSDYPGGSLPVLVEWLTYGGVFWVLTNLQAPSQSHRERDDGKIRPEGRTTNSSLQTGDALRGFFLRLLWASAFAVILFGLFQQFVNLPLLRRQVAAEPERVLSELRVDWATYRSLAERARYRIYSTFRLPNGLAGFLALLIPGFLGHVLDRLRAGERGKGFVAASALWLASALACLFLTYSRGGWIAFGVGMGAFCLMLGKGTLRRHARLVGGLAAGAALAIVLLFASGRVPAHVVRGAAASYEVRVGYWRGALAMARDNFWGGVGLGTFGAHYPRYRWPQAEPAQLAHNDYLQVLAELGVFGLLAFLGVWAAGLTSALRPCLHSSSSSTLRAFRAPSLGLACVAGAIAFVLAWAVSPVLSFAGWGTEPWWRTLPKGWADAALVLVLGAGWLAFLLALGGWRPGEPGERCRKGLACGLIAFLVHSTADFGYYEPGLAFSAWAVAALGAAPRREPAEVRIGRRAAGALGGAALLLLLAGSFVLTQGIRAGVEASRAASREALAAGERSPARRAELIREALTRYQRAIEANPLDSSVRLEYGELIERLALAARDKAALRVAAALYGEAASLNRASADPHLFLARLYEHAIARGLEPRTFELAKGRPQGGRSAAWRAVLPEYRAAAELHPSSPALRLLYAEALRECGDLGAAANQAALALHYHELATRRRPENPVRLMPAQVDRAVEFLRRAGVNARR